MDLVAALHAHRPAGFHPRYALELLYENAPALSPAALNERLAVRSPGVETSAGDGGELRLRSHQHPGGGMTPEWSLRPQQSLDPARLAPAVEQSWWWPDGAQCLSRCRAAVRLEDDGIAGLDHGGRIGGLRRVLVALLESAPCLAIHWAPTQQLVDPVELVHSCVDHDFDSPLPGAINVRFFRSSEGNEVTYLMDTLGLTAVGLLDLQCRFRGLDPNDVSEILYQAALYQWQRGAVIQDGDSVEGPGRDDRWQASHQYSLALPRRDLIDLDPGFPFAAPGAG
jgi:hypothetical protein